MNEIVNDLRAEQESLDAFVASLTDNDWALPTPAEGWSIQDSLSHIASTDDVALAAIAGDNTYFELAKKIGTAFNEEGVMRGRLMKPSQVLAWWRKSRQVMNAELIKLDPKVRLPWFALPMGARSFATARLMEIWAHGLDCYDAIGAQALDTDRLRHIAYLAWQARPYSYSVHGLSVPDTPLRIELTLPSGKKWEHGPEGAKNIISGSASGFCRVAVRRRHWKDTDLQIKGSEALRFMTITQAYAGPPGSGRKPSTGGSVI